jgi:hypothetical protein
MASNDERRTANNEPRFYLRRLVARSAAALIASDSQATTSPVRL